MSSDKDEQVAQLVDQIRRADSAGDNVSAVRYCLDAVALKPEDWSLLLWLGWLYFNSKQYERAMECAQLVMKLDAGHDPSSYRLLVFASAASGNWEAAGRTLAKLGDVSSDACLNLAGEVVGSFWDYLAVQSQSGNYGAVIQAYRSLPAVIKQLKDRNRFDIDLMAAHAYVMAGNDLIASEILAGPKAASDAPSTFIANLKPFTGITLITSLMPARHEIQRLAISSWRSYGANVLSINSDDEIKLLRDVYSDVTFLSAPRDSRLEYGKPYIYMADMISALCHSGDEVVGVINSDIILSSSNLTFMREIKEAARHSVVYGHRFDVDSVKEIARKPNEGQLFVGGIDWFMFPKGKADVLADQPFIFGCPWWDLWLPVLASANKLETCLANGKLAFHETHSQRWNTDIFAELAQVILDEIASIEQQDSLGYSARQLAAFADACGSESQFGLEPVRFAGRLSDFIKALIHRESLIINEV